MLRLRTSTLQRLLFTLATSLPVSRWRLGLRFPVRRTRSWGLSVARLRGTTGTTLHQTKHGGAAAGGADPGDTRASEISVASALATRLLDLG